MKQQKHVNAELILASKNALTGDILYTWVLTFPRQILAEVNTHRMGSKNTSSSRAIPNPKQRAAIKADPFVPISWGQKKKGMQQGAEITGWRAAAATAVWRGARYPNLLASWALDKLGVHKTQPNRLLEPWMWTQQLFSATDVNNLFQLRDHHAAEVHFQALAKQMHGQAEYAQGLFEMMKKHSIQSCMPGVGRLQVLRPEEWHLPFIDEEDRKMVSELLVFKFSSQLQIDRLKKISAARCARVSYLLPETGKRSTYERDMERYESLAESTPKHLSPLEHVATPLPTSEYLGNFRGWKQFRKEIVGEDGGDRRP